jgi:hypothetical protein
MNGADVLDCPGGHVAGAYAPVLALQVAALKYAEFV